MTSNEKLLVVPEAVSKIVFPNEQLSISNFVEYPLPAITSVPIDVPLADFFDAAEPSESVDLSKPTQQPLPPAYMVRRLVQTLSEQVATGKRSVTCAHRGMFSLRRLPFWVLGY
ncbi:MAG TPA: hypothetical protein VGO47_12680 [Chlamydiales bacterium]|nr:hypothetical protein [Chlamydiales bacterium]